MAQKKVASTAGRSFACLMADEAKPEPLPLHEFVERELGFRNVVRKLRRAALRSAGGIRHVPRPESWLQAEEILVKPNQAFNASQAFQVRVLSKLREDFSSNEWLFTGWCSVTRSVVTLNAADFEYEHVEIPTAQVGRVQNVTVAKRRPLREEIIVEAIEQICADGFSCYVGWTIPDIQKMVEGRLGRLGKTQFAICLRDANIDERSRRSGRPKMMKPIETE